MNAYLVKNGYFSIPGEETVVIAPSMEQAILKYKYAVQNSMKEIEMKDKELEQSLKSENTEPRDIKLIASMVIK